MKQPFEITLKHKGMINGVFHVSLKKIEYKHMKKTILITLFLLGSMLVSQAQVAGVALKSIEGKSVNTADIAKMGKPIIVSFFSTWCKPCLRELKAIHEEYDEWQEKTGVELIAVSIDDAQNSAKVKTLVDGFGWRYSVWLDPNGDFKRAMGVNMIPAVFVFNSKGKLIFSKNGYTDGSENELIDKIKEAEKE